MILTRKNIRLISSIAMIFVDFIVILAIAGMTAIAYFISIEIQSKFGDNRGILWMLALLWCTIVVLLLHKDKS
jgi:hypothetical protein